MNVASESPKPVSVTLVPTAAFCALTSLICGHDQPGATGAPIPVARSVPVVAVKLFPWTRARSLLPLVMSFSETE